MNNEFKKISEGNTTRFVLEFTGGGVTGTSSVTTGIAQPMGAVRKRDGANLINQEGKKSYKMPKRPNNPVAKAHQSIGTGSGEHTKKKNVLPRKEKHKKQPELAEAAYTGDYNTDEKNIQHLMRKYHWTRQEAEEHLTSSDSDGEQFDEANIDPNAPYTPSPAKPFRNPRHYGPNGAGTELARQNQSTMSDIVKDFAKKWMKKFPGNPVDTAEQNDEAYEKYADIFVRNFLQKQGVEITPKTMEKARSDFDYYMKQEFELHSNEQGVAEGKAQINFDVEDLKRLERIRDLPTLKAQAFELISKPSAKPMKPEKVQWFKSALENMNSPMKVIKLMYDLLLSGEGHAVVGSKSSMNPNSYRQRFGEEMAETNDEYDDEAGMAHTDLHTIARAAQGLLDTIDDKENLPEWAQEKIAKVEGMLTAVWDYLQSQEEQGINPQQKEEDAYTSRLQAQLEGQLSPQDPDGVWIDNFEKADPNKYRQFKNKSPVKKRQMALAAHRDSLKTK
jgi:hypothetical protein